MTKICFGCGIKLQSDNKEKLGYIPKEKIEDSIYCQRCFKLTHYGINNKTNKPKETKNIINSINKDNKHVTFITDFLSINSNIIDIYNQITKPKIFLISKCDIIPKSIKEEKIRLYLQKEYNIKEKIIFVSTNLSKVETLLNYYKNNNIKETYIIGKTNSGKSTLINNIIDITKSKQNKLTTSNTFNTTLDFIRLKINNNLTIIDSPGFITNDNDTNYELKKSIKPRTYQMKKEEILLIDNIYLKFLENTNLTIYCSNSIKIKKYYKQDIIFTNSIEINNNQDLLIENIGFINIKNKTKISLSNLNQELLEIRNSIFGDNYEQN